MKLAFAASVVLLLTVSCGQSSAFDFYGCIFRCPVRLARSIGPSLIASSCPAWKMIQAYRDMVSANCKKCDKYFHCMGNYNAVHHCGANVLKNRLIAKAISDCRELCQSEKKRSSAADQVANRYGRNGGNCAGKYLCAYGCAYNPHNKSCKRKNCRRRG
ncbi:hypothetical protein BOX15_Mlig010572g1 [Macrostomum lignano]|uniref:Serum amyloid A protein n=1 Tax=Macrostomum lignano TaxID=282301 RepID=A0A267GM84_9PLAT|nr:hypothetical protein BOX15_Mlig010572g1 [Macrostomum lignano]